MERLKVKVAVYGILRNSGKVLFIRRCNTGWMDGRYSLPSGHVETGELPAASMVRELEEEVNVIASSSAIELAHTMYRRDQYVDFYFNVKSYAGTVKLRELDKSNDLIWLDPGNENPLVIPTVKLALQNVEAGIHYSELDESVVDRAST